MVTCATAAHTAINKAKPRIGGMMRWPISSRQSMPGLASAAGRAAGAAAGLAAAGAAEQAGAGKAIRVLEEFRRHLEPLSRRQQEENEALVAATRVAFGSLRPERVDFGSLGGA